MGTHCSWVRWSGKSGCIHRSTAYRRWWNYSLITPVWMSLKEEREWLYSLSSFSLTEDSGSLAQSIAYQSSWTSADGGKSCCYPWGCRSAMTLNQQCIARSGSPPLHDKCISLVYSAKLMSERIKNQIPCQVLERHISVALHTVFRLEWPIQEEVVGVIVRVTLYSGC